MRRADEIPPRAARRGFTLIEIMVALSAGVLVSIAAFAISKNANNFYQQEARIAATQLSLTLGLNRLTADLQRASFLSTPNAYSDPMVCRHSSWSSATGLNRLAGITVKQGSLGSSTQSGQNGMKPDQIIIGGAFDVAESFTVQCVLSGGSGVQLQLQDAAFDGAMARVLSSLGTGETLQSRLNNMFGSTGRLVQLLDPATGFKVYGMLATGTPVAVAGNVATVQLQAPPSLPTKPTNPCGIIAPPACGGGLLMSVVSRVKYDVRSMAGNTTYAGLVTPIAAATTGDGGRTELVRVELDANDAEVPATEELVAEYTVDMRVGLTAVSDKITADNYNPSVITYEIGDANIYNIAGDPTLVTSKPQYVRSVQVRLSTRARTPDRDADLPTGYDGRKLRFLVPGTPKPWHPEDKSSAGYARLRTAYTNVSLINQGGFSLW